jgi:hypothetical protein
VFVVGKNRSGTKWISNLVSNHPQVASVQHKYASGILETHLFDKASYMFGDISNKGNYISFCESYSQSNFFKLTGLKKAILYDDHLKSYSSVFERVMGKYANKNKKNIWLQKANPEVLETLVKDFRNAKFIFIERDIVDNISSSLALLARNKYFKNHLDISFLHTLKHLFVYLYNSKLVKKYEKKVDCIKINYSQIIEDREIICKKICEFLEIDFSDEMMVDKYEKNTSYIGNIDKEKILSEAEEKTIRLIAPLLVKLPLSLFKTLIYSWRYFSNRKFVPSEPKLNLGESYSIRQDELGL